MNDKEKIILIGKILAAYEFEIATSDLPWRRFRTPYRILLAEMMLVRTRTAVVSGICEEVFAKYPDIKSLSQADEDDLCDLLRPLGLKKRASYMIEAAKYICEIYAGEIPYQIENLLKIPGIGIYTAVAEATFAYGYPLVPTDVNILRFVSRITGFPMDHPTKGSDALKELVVFLSETHTQLSAEKLLDFTRLICRPRTPLCNYCPLTIHCEHFGVNLHESNTN